MASVDYGDVQFFSVVLFKIGSLILAVLLGLQLTATTLNIPFDINSILTAEQFLFVYAVLIVTLLSFIEGRTLQVRDKEAFVPAIMLYIVTAIGIYFTYFIFLGGNNFTAYNFDNSTMNAYIGYYLLFGGFLIFINGRKQIFKRFLK